MLRPSFCFSPNSIFTTWGPEKCLGQKCCHGISGHSFYESIIQSLSLAGLKFSFCSLNLCLEIKREWLTSAGKCPSVVSPETRNCPFGVWVFHIWAVTCTGTHCRVCGKELKSTSVTRRKDAFPLSLAKAPASHQALCPQGCTL